ncbi:LysR family transcriptional regulator [Lysinibacillus endophyticus]|uniref:LysR family transcriptional regulator n=1 Tax=Ureibacillus endophyticus TaxID=1978490 RepID=UPI0020A22A1A|nr:LysR family transcriptional regulator [Lysinibacillus endophyticus]MCP1146702.1 LysR family transcriptional regulator [Lysinibacillus endophyticus]
MNKQDWVLIQTVYEEKNLTRASRRLHMSQPALTYRINQIEKDLNIKVFTKVKNGIDFTPEGEIAYQFATKMNNEYLNFLDKLAETKKELHGEIRLGANTNIVRYDLTNILKSFTAKYPNIRFKIESGTNHKIWSDMLNDKFHVAFIRGDYYWNGPKELQREDQICLMSREPLDLEHLYRHKRITQKMDPQVAEEDHKWWYERFNVPQNIFIEVDNPETCREMMLHGLGYCALPYSIIKKEVEEAKLPLFIEPMHFIDGRPFLRNQWALYKEESLKLEIIQVFKKESNAYFRGN